MSVPAEIALVVDGREVVVPDEGSSLLDVLRERLGLTSAKDGCSPQGQCGCCTVLVDGAPRVACVTPVRRVAGRAITTLEGLDADVVTSWADAFVATGASQCGFCTPGIIMRFDGLRAKGVGADDTAAIERALQAHLCRCTGWRTIVDAYSTRVGAPGGSEVAVDVTGPSGRDLDAAGRRATIEGRTPQHVGSDVVLGRAGFAADTAPAGALVAVPDGTGGWAVGESLAAARLAAGKVQGRRTTAETAPPLELPAGDWAVTLRTSWVEPAYLETDASWCEPGGEPVSPLANGGAFGGKVDSPVAAAARELADLHGRPVQVLFSREDAVRQGAKRPPIAAGIRADGTGVVRVARTTGIAERIRAIAPRLEVEEVDLPGPPTSLSARAAGWAEAAVLMAAIDRRPLPGWSERAVRVQIPGGGVAVADVERRAGAGDGEGEGDVDGDGELVVRVHVSCGDPLDEVVLRSYAIGAAHMAIGWVTSEGLAVDEAGEIHDLTIRSFGVPRAIDTPPIEIEIDRGYLDGSAPGEPVNGSDAVFAAVAAAVWRHQGLPPDWPTGIPLRR
ncbi:MAG: 2Fe-2S iron-sulfur cluster-binding protein [Acidimicrobiales bacterium]